MDWSDMSTDIQAYYDNSPGSRAAIFFASAACALAQVCVNMILNSVAAAMDMSAYSPQWLTTRRCSYIIAALGIVTNPWQITTTASLPSITSYHICALLNPNHRLLGC